MSKRRFALLAVLGLVGLAFAAGVALAGKPAPPPMTNPAISYIALTGSSYTTAQVFVMTANGAQKKQLTTGKGNKRKPDGDFIHDASST